MTLIEQINKDRLPRHIAVIMDGNGRWAKKKGNPRIFGHKNGVKAVRAVTEAAAEIGLNYLTLYAFSTENWKRPKNEIDALMTLLVSTINSETKTLNENNIRLQAIGDLNNLPKSVYRKLFEAIEITKNNSGLTLVLALSYSSKWEIINAVKRLAEQYSENIIDLEQIDEKMFEENLVTNGIPNPELLIRTSGEKRISNFLLWQIAYAELYFTDVLWPDFKKEDFYKAIIDFQSRERRFGKISEQLSMEDKE